MDQPDQPDLSRSDRIAVNGLTPAGLLTTSLGTATLTGTALSPYSTNVTFLSYLAGCALDSTQTITVGTATYKGVMGVAPAWTSRALTTAEQQNVSGCLLARVNYNGVNVTISERGNGTGYTTTAAEQSGYTYEEGSFYGNVLAGTTDTHSCMGNDQVANPTGNPYIGQRLCAGSNVCGFTYEGACSAVCGAHTADGWQGCHGTGGGNYGQAVTTFLGN